MKNDKITGCFMWLGGIVVVVVAAVGAVLLNGWALSVLWGWFIVPLFSVPALPVLYAIGIGFIASLLRPAPSTSEEESKEDLGIRIVKVITQIIALPLSAVFFGWIVHSFIH
jgi:hypothetical protein